MPPIHILMPVYNAEQYIEAAIESVVSQTYSNIVLLIVDDFSTDKTCEIIKRLQEKYVDKIQLRHHSSNKGVSAAHETLLTWSKQANPQAYVGWLDADDQFTDPSYISHVMQQLVKKEADICLVSTNVIYEDEAQRANAAGLLKDLARSVTIIDHILGQPSQTVTFDTYPDDAHPKITAFTSLGWTKFYSPAAVAKFPNSVHYPFVDFPPMALFYSDFTITALKEPGHQYLRRGGSIGGNRVAANFTRHIPAQLACFFVTVLRNLAGSPKTPAVMKRLNAANDFVIAKADQYKETVDAIVKSNKFADIDATVQSNFIFIIASLLEAIGTIIENIKNATQPEFTDRTPALCAFIQRLSRADETVDLRKLYKNLLGKEFTNHSTPQEFPHLK